MVQIFHSYVRCPGGYGFFPQRTTEFSIEHQELRNFQDRESRPAAMIQLGDHSGYRLWLLQREFHRAPESRLQLMGESKPHGWGHGPFFRCTPFSA